MRYVRRLGFLIAFLLTLSAVDARAQYVPTPNRTGAGAGTVFLGDLNARFGGTVATAPSLVPVTYTTDQTLPANITTAIFNCSVTCTAQLPAAPTIGKLYIVKNITANTVNVTPNGSDTIDGSNSPVILGTAYSQTTVQYTAANKWSVVFGGGSGSGSGFPLAADVSGASHTITSIRSAVASGEPVSYAQSGAQLTVNQNTTSLVSTGTVSSAGGSPAVVAAPASIVSGRALVLVILADGTPTITQPSGFALIRSSVSGAVTFATYCKTAGGSEPGTYSTSFTGGGTGARAYITQLAGTDCSHKDGDSGAVAAYPSLPTVPGVATLHTNDLILAVGAMYCGDIPNVNIGTVFYNNNTVGALVGSWRIQPNIGTSTAAIVGQVPANCAGGALVAGQQIAFAPITTNQSSVIVGGQSGVSLGTLSASVNGVRNVMATYGAAGDGNTDDTAAIQQCVYDMCGNSAPYSSNAQGSCYLPPTAKCYLHSAPIRLPCPNAELWGQSFNSSRLCQNYAGDALIQNGWGVSNLPYDTALVGSGNSLISPGPIQLPQSIDADRWINGTGTNNFASKVTANGFNISLYMKRTAAGGIVFCSREAYPAPVGHDQFCINLSAVSNTGVAANLYTSAGTTITLGNGSCGAQTISTVYEVELDWDKTTYRLWQGVPGGTAVLCSSQVDSNGPVASPFFETLLPPGGRHQFWPDGSNNLDNSFTGDLDGVWIRTHSKHTTAYTVPNIKPVSDGDTFYLNNFEASLDGTQIARHASNNQVIYQTVLSSGIGATAGTRIHDLELCSNANGNAGSPDGLFAASGNSSYHWNLQCSNAYFAQFEEFGQMYLANFENLHGFGGHVGLIKGSQLSGSHVSNIGTDGTDVACEVAAGGGGGNYSESTPVCVDRGGLIYGWMENGDSATYVWPFVDQEAANPSWKGTFLLHQPGPNYVFTGGNIDTRAGAPYFLVDGGGAGSTITGMVFNTFGQDQNAVDIVHFINGNPNSRWIIENSSLPKGVPISNLPQYFELDNNTSRKYVRGLFASAIDGLNVLGSVKITALGTPVAPVASVQGTAGSTTYGPFYEVCEGSDGITTSPPSLASNTITTGNASITNLNYIRLALTEMSGCALVKILAGDTAHTLNGYQDVIPMVYTDGVPYINITSYATTGGYSNAGNSGSLTVAGAASISGAGSFGAALSMPNLVFSTIYSVAGTPVPTASSNAHAGLCVSDATACTVGTTYVGSSSTACHLHSDGTNWKEDGFGC